MERVLKGDTKAEFTQQANLVERFTVDNFTIVMAYNDRVHFSCAGLLRPETVHV